MVKKTETEILFPERDFTDKTGAVWTVSPFTFGQTARSLELLLPLMSGVDISQALESGGDKEALKGAINLNVLLYALVANECDNVLQLMALATNKPIQEIARLTPEDGMDLLMICWQVAVKPAIEMLGKKLKAMIMPGQMQSSDLNAQDLVVARSEL